MSKLQAEFTNYMKKALKNDSIDYFRTIKNSWNIEVLSIDNINKLEVFISHYSDFDTSFFLPNYLDKITKERLFFINFLLLAYQLYQQQQVHLSFHLYYHLKNFLIDKL